MFSVRGPFAILALCLAIGSTTLYALEPSIDHLPTTPMGGSGQFISTGVFDLPVGYTLIKIQVHAANYNPSASGLVYTVPVANYSVTGTSGTWNVPIPAPAAQYSVKTFIELQNDTTGEITKGDCRNCVSRTNRRIRMNLFTWR